MRSWIEDSFHSNNQLAVIFEISADYPGFGVARQVVSAQHFTSSRQLHMRKMYITLAVMIALPLACPILAAHAGGQGQDEKPAEQARAPEIDVLVKQLGDSNFAIRAQASRSIEQTPGALAKLRPFLKHDVLEIRRRVEDLVESLAARNLKSLLREIVQRKADVPLDLLTDVVVENRERMDDDDWKGVLDAIACLRNNLLPDPKSKIFEPDPPRVDFLKLPLVRGESLSKTDRPFLRKVVGTRIGSVVDLTSSVAITSGSYECGSPAKSIVLANRGVLMNSAIGSFVFSNEDIKCRAANHFLIIAKSTVNVTLRSDNFLSKNFVISGGDINCDRIFESTAIAAGRVNAKQITRSTIFEKGTESAKISCFSMKAVGVTLVPDGKAFRVEKVAVGSRASKCGFRVGDLLIPDAASGLADVEAVLRRRVAKETEPAIAVRRSGVPTFVVLRLWD